MRWVSLISVFGGGGRMAFRVGLVWFGLVWFWLVGLLCYSEGRREGKKERRG